MVWVADRHNNLVAKGKVIDTLAGAIALGDPIRYEENDDLQANIYIEDEGWFAVVGDKEQKNLIAGYAGVFGRTIKSVEQFEKVYAKHPFINHVRTDDGNVAYVGFKGAGEFMILPAARAAIWKAALATFADR